MSSKIFLTYEDQIKKLNEKNLIIEDEEYAVTMLKKIKLF